MQIATFKPRRVYHVGSCNPNAPRRGGLEGLQFSVSLHPTSWRAIARLGGRPLWKITKKGGIRLIDRLAINESMLEDICTKAEATGLVERIDAWKVWTANEEGEKAYSIHLDEADARDEVEELEDIDEDEAAKALERVRVWSTLPKGIERFGRVGNGLDDNAVDVAIMAFAEDGGWDGVWWNELLDPLALSAPRGCILQSRLDAFERREIPWSHAPQEDW